MIYSEYLETMIPKGFTITKVYFNKQGNEKYYVSTKEHHYTWHEEDLVYYSDIIDGRYYMEVPRNGSKTFSLKLGFSCRLKVVLDK